MKGCNIIRSTYVKVVLLEKPATCEIKDGVYETACRVLAFKCKKHPRWSVFDDEESIDCSGIQSLSSDDMHEDMKIIEAAAAAEDESPAKDWLWAKIISNNVCDALSLKKNMILECRALETMGNGEERISYMVTRWRCIYKKRSWKNRPKNKLVV